MQRTIEQIQARFDNLNREVLLLVEEADSRITERLELGVSFTYSISAPRPELTPYEKAQSLCFVTKYDSLPENYQVEIKEHKGRHYPNNIDDFRHLLNEYRAVIQNKKDSTHYSRVHHLCRQKLTNDPRVDLSITAKDSAGADITERFLRLLDQKSQAIAWLIGKCDYDYLYNGILQHADHKHTERYIREYASGELHYIFFKHAVASTYIKKELWWHYQMLRILSGVAMGPL